jgi:pimeloyl-ACP methyl ester carboxylesterase
MNTVRWRWALAMLAAVVLGLSTRGQAQRNDDDDEDNGRKPLALSDQGLFFVGGRYVEVAGGLHIMADQMYVRFQIPHKVKHPYPVVMIHGGGQTGTNFEGTPDGRDGWGTFFLREGYAVYIVDQPGRARSPYQTEAYGPLGTGGRAETVEQRFTAVERFNLWPQAHVHTQWPGTGVRGDPSFDEFFASQVAGISSTEIQQTTMRDAAAALLDRIGPAIVLTHSQSGPYGWFIADARPQLVKGILAVEPSGPPFFNSNQIGAPTWFSEATTLARSWGITSIPITYAPAVSDPSELSTVRQTTPDRPDVVPCRMQTEPARRLPTLQGIPILIIAGEASYHASYDHCTSKYLTQAGVQNTFVRLQDVGIRGNGHMMMLEKNNLKIAAFMASWLEENVEEAQRGRRREGGRQ